MQKYIIPVKLPTSLLPEFLFFVPLLHYSPHISPLCPLCVIFFPLNWFYYDFGVSLLLFLNALMMNYTERFGMLNAAFDWDTTTVLPESTSTIRFCTFRSNTSLYFKASEPENLFSDDVTENKSFTYPVFVPAGVEKSADVILLMHGLNERNWNKYLTWAEFLCNSTGKTVVLFPIAFHINRSPASWSDPRYLHAIYDLRKRRNANDRSLSLANVALSERITQAPYRFYSSGRQSVDDITQLVTDIKSGNHPLFCENTKVDVFAYSIGAFLSQIIFMTNPGNLFSDAKLFMFCGGSIFSDMFGQSRTIMDKQAFDRLFSYYLNDFPAQNEQDGCDKAFRSFYSMIAPERNATERVLFFNALKKRLSGISLQRDVVIPYQGVEKALGMELAHKCIDLLDFDFDYTHENPFPVNGRIDRKKVDASFEQVFSKAAEFLK